MTPLGRGSGRKVGRSGKISFASVLYRVGVWLAGEIVEVTVDAGLVTISHRGVVVATHAQRHRPDKEAKALRRKPRAQRSPSCTRYRSVCACLRCPPQNGASSLCEQIIQLVGLTTS